MIRSWLELAVEVKQRPLRSGAGEEARSGGGGGRRRRGAEEEEEEEEGGTESYVRI